LPEYCPGGLCRSRAAIPLARPLTARPWNVRQDFIAIVQLVAVDEGTRGDDAALAAALGLKRIGSADRKATTSPELARTLIAAARPAAAISSVPFEDLRGRLDIIQPRLDPIVAAIEQGIQSGGKARDNARQMFRLLETVSRDSIAPYLDRIEAMRVKDGSFVFKPAKSPG
jgi:hypothetical protein